MGYVGNRRGPRKSTIVSNLGPEYFGITPEQLVFEIGIEEVEEREGIIDPVSIDKNKKPYLLFNTPGNKTQKYYLEEHGYKLKGKVLALLKSKEVWITF